MTREQERERNLEQLGHRPLLDRVEIKLVGCSFVEGYPRTLLDLEPGIVRESYEDDAGYGLWRNVRTVPAELVRAPNEHDAMAVAVKAGGGRIGYVPRAIAARLAPELDAGIVWTCQVTRIVRTEQEPDQPGAWLLLERA